MVKGGIDLSPHTLFFGFVPQGAEKQASVTLTSLPDSSVRVLWVRTPRELAVTITRGSSPGSYLLSARTLPAVTARLPGGLRRGTLTVRIAGADVDEVSIPYHLHLVPPAPAVEGHPPAPQAKLQSLL